MIQSRLIAVAGALLMLSAQFAHAQNFDLQTIDSAAKFQAIPDNVAFDLLGIQGGMSQPGTVSQFLASLTSFVDVTGNLNVGQAISFAPYQLLASDSLAIERYAREFLLRALVNTQFSIGSAPRVDADSSLSWALGVKTSLISPGDGRLDTAYIVALAEPILKVIEDIPMPSAQGCDASAYDSTLAIRNMISAAQETYIGLSENSVDNVVDDLRTGIEAVLVSLGNTECAKRLREIVEQSVYYSKESARARFIQYRKYREAIDAALKTDHHAWNSASLDINTGIVYRSSSSTVRSSDISKYRVWMSGGIGFDAFQVLGQVGYFHQNAIDDRRDDTKQLQPDSAYTTASLLCRVGNMNLRLGLGANANISMSDASASNGTMMLLTEIRMGRMIWAVAGLVGKFAHDQHPTWSPILTLKTTGGIFGN